jgi:hypothetical protein
MNDIRAGPRSLSAPAAAWAAVSPARSARGVPELTYERCRMEASAATEAALFEMDSPDCRPPRRVRVRGDRGRDMAGGHVRQLPSWSSWTEREKIYGGRSRHSAVGVCSLLLVPRETTSSRRGR